MFRRFCVYGFVVGVMCIPVDAEELSMGHVQIERRAQGWVHLAAKGVSLTVILKEFSRVLAVDVEQNGLSNELINLNCDANEPRGMLKCLVGGGVSFMIQSHRYDCPLVQSAWCGIRIKVWQDALAQVGPDAFARLREVAPEIEKMLRSTNADERAKGLDAVVANQAIEGPLAVLLLKDLSRDRQSTVRASAVHGAALFEGAESQTLIREASRDASAEVRLMAIDALEISEETRAIFEGALTDEDPQVRELAGSRLEVVYTMRRSKVE